MERHPMLAPSYLLTVLLRFALTLLSGYVSGSKRGDPCSLDSTVYRQDL
mgnify:CR=1 FL=1|jgi:hypothetical protein